MTQSFKSPERVFRAIYIGGGVRVRARASADNLISVWLRSLRSRVPAIFQSDVNSSRVGNWRSQPVERCTPYVSVPGWLRHLLPALRGDTRLGFLNLCRPKPITAGKCFAFLRSRVQACKQARGIDLVLLRKNYLPLLAAHESNVSGEMRHERQVTCKG